MNYACHHKQLQKMLQISIAKRPPYVQLLERALWICVPLKHDSHLQRPVSLSL